MFVRNYPSVKYVLIFVYIIYRYSDIDGYIKLNVDSAPNVQFNLKFMDICPRYIFTFLISILIDLIIFKPYFNQAYFTN